MLYAFADELIQHVEAKYYASDAATVDPQTRNINVVHDCFGVSLIQLAKDNGFTREQIQSELLNFILAGKFPYCVSTDKIMNCFLCRSEEAFGSLIILARVFISKLFRGANEM